MDMGLDGKGRGKSGDGRITGIRDRGIGIRIARDHRGQHRSQTLEPPGLS